MLSPTSGDTHLTFFTSHNSTIFSGSRAEGN